MSPRRHPPRGPRASSRARRPSPARPQAVEEPLPPITFRPEEDAALLAALAPLVPAADLDATAEAIRAFLRGLVRWNVRSNLVAAGDRDRLVRRHVVESLACVPLLDHLGGETLIDLGSGGGFPGIPIKLVRPGIRVALLESRRIKSLFLKRTIRELGLSGAEAWQIRIEALATLPDGAASAEAELPVSGEGARPGGPAATAPPAPGPISGDLAVGDPLPAVRPLVDLVTARAVAALPTIAEWVAPVVRSGGGLVTFKGSRVDDEIEAWRQAPGPWELERVEREAVPGLTLVALRRV